jgi:hypothetical protein
LAAKSIKPGGVLFTQCPSCKIEHAFRCIGTRSRASYDKRHPNGESAKKAGQLWGWVSTGCKSDEAKDGKLYFEFPEPAKEEDMFTL